MSAISLEAVSELAIPSCPDRVFPELTLRTWRRLYSGGGGDVNLREMGFGDGIAGLEAAMGALSMVWARA
jgi:hypothetical protein